MLIWKQGACNTVSGTLKRSPRLKRSPTLKERDTQASPLPRRRIQVGVQQSEPLDPELGAPEMRAVRGLRAARLTEGLAGSLNEKHAP